MSNISAGFGNSLVSQSKSVGQVFFIEWFARLDQTGVDWDKPTGIWNLDFDLRF